MPVCAVLTCKSSAEDSDGPQKDLSFHRFPKNEEVKKRWVELSGRENWAPNDSSYVCSRHFRDTDYIVKRSGNRHLKVTAIPCEYVVYRHLLPDDDTTVADTNEDREATPASSPTPTMSTHTPIREADTTSNYDEFNLNDSNDNTIGWDHFQHFGQREPEPIMKRHSSTAGPVKRKRGKKSKAKKHRNSKPLDLSLTMENFQPQIEEVVAPTDEIQPLIGEAQPPLEEIHLPFEEIESVMEEVDFSVEEVRPPTPDVRPPSNLNEQLNQIKLLLANRKESRRVE